MGEQHHKRKRTRFLILGWTVPLKWQENSHNALTTGQTPCADDHNVQTQIITSLLFFPMFSCSCHVNMCINFSDVTPSTHTHTHNTHPKRGVFIAERRGVERGVFLVACWGHRGGRWRMEGTLVCINSMSVHHDSSTQSHPFSHVTRKLLALGR